MEEGALTLEHVEMVGNNATDGGALWLADQGSLSACASTASGNTPNDVGGAAPACAIRCTPYCSPPPRPKGGTVVGTLALRGLVFAVAAAVLALHTAALVHQLFQRDAPGEGAGAPKGAPMRCSVCSAWPPA